MCPHCGQATPTTPNPRVMVGGMAVSTMAPAYSVTGCPNSGESAGAALHYRQLDYCSDAGKATATRSCCSIARR